MVRARSLGLAGFSVVGFSLTYAVWACVTHKYASCEHKLFLHMLYVHICIHIQIEQTPPRIDMHGEKE